MCNLSYGVNPSTPFVLTINTNGAEL